MSLKNTCILLNKSEDLSTSPKTFIVFGTPRGGTTMVAGVINILGVDIGQNLPINCEDSDFNLDYLRSIGCKDPITSILNTIAERNSQKECWGWKFPAASRYMDKILSHVRNPHLICVFRDPLSISMRGVLRRSQNPFDSINHIISMQKLNLTIIEKHQLPTLLVSYEKAVRYPQKFVNEISSFVGLGSKLVSNKAINFISVEGGYQPISDEDSEHYRDE